MWRLAVAAMCGVLIAYPTVAQQQLNDAIPKERSKLVLNMPGLQGGRETYQYLGWRPDYSLEMSYGAQVANRKAYPRAQVYLSVLPPGRVGPLPVT